MKIDPQNAQAFNNLGVLLEDTGRDVRVPDGAEVDRVEPAQLFEDGVGQDVARLLVALAPQIELR